MHLIVASQNPVKIKAVETAFAQLFPDEIIHIKGISALSGVADQPMSDEETYQGALNRLQYIKTHHSLADYRISIESWLEVNTQGMLCTTRVLVENSSNKQGKAKSGGFYLPLAAEAYIRTGMELWHVTDKIFKLNNSKHTTGIIGLLTNNHYRIVDYYADAVILAAIPFLHPELYTN